MSTLVISLLALGCSKGNVNLIDDTQTDDTASGGAWTADLAGYAQFEENWETEPYCAGTLELVSDGAQVTGTGDCVITFGPAMGAEFTVSAEGTQSGSTLSVEIAFDYETDERSWDAADVDVDVGSTDEARGATTYWPSTGQELDSWIGVTLKGG